MLGGIFSSAHSARFTAHKAMWTSEQADPAGSFPIVAETETNADRSPKPSLFLLSPAVRATAESEEKVRELCDQTVLGGVLSSAT